MREQERSAHVPRGKYVRSARLEEVVDPDPSALGGHPGGRQVQPGRARLPAGREQDLFGNQVVHLAPDLGTRLLQSAFLVEMVHLGLGQENHANLLERVLDNPAQLGFLAGQQRLALVHERHLDAEGREQVRKFAADGAATNDDHAGGQLRQAHRFIAGDRLHFV